MSCTHNTSRAHWAPGATPRGGHIWICSGCGKRGEWTAAWRYHGALECPACQETRVDWVACSPACAKKMPAEARR